MKRILIILAILFAVIPLSAQSYRIFGGKEHTEYLGKWASPYNSESIWNKYGKYGRCYESKSIWNKYGENGSTYNSYSPWNTYSSNPPILVDDNDRVVGYLSVGYKANTKMRELMNYILEHFDEVASDPTAFFDNVIKKQNYGNPPLW